MQRCHNGTLLVSILVLLSVGACHTSSATPTATFESAQPTFTPPAPTPTATSIPILIFASFIPPTQPALPAAITPDPIQVERWKEYEVALARALFRSSFIPDQFLCEWEILGRSESEVYVWTVCMSIFPVANDRPLDSTMPVVIDISADGSIQTVEIPGGGTNYASDIREMFPTYAQEKYFDSLIQFQELTDQLNWRRKHPQEPPLLS
jgi:hypothetical protein